MIWYASDNPNGWRTGQTYSLEEPALTVMAGGMCGDRWERWHLYATGRDRMLLGVGTNTNFQSRWQSPDLPSPTIAVMVKSECAGWVAFDGRPEPQRQAMTEKPPYRALMMADVEADPLNGLTHVSTFSGCGGSCLGFRLAGFRTLWANDLEEHARRCYAANLSSPIDGRDIRHVTAAHILEATGLAVGELDVFEGSPPCTAFSTAGQRAKGWNQTKDHAGHVQTNVEDLFYEWLRLLEGLQPRAFVAENVTGMVKGVAKGYFKDVLRKMKSLGYQTEARVLDGQWLGIPQRRERVIFIGLRADLNAAPRFPAPLSYRYSVREALPWLSHASFDPHGQFMGTPDLLPTPSRTLTASNAYHFEVSDSPVQPWTDGALTGPVRPLIMPPSRQREKADGRAFSVKDVDPDQPCQTVTIHGGNDLCVPDGFIRRRRFTLGEVKRLCSFPDDFVLEGTFTQQWARLGNSVPPLMAKAIAEAVRDALLGDRKA